MYLQYREERAKVCLAIWNEEAEAYRSPTLPISENNQ